MKGLPLQLVTVRLDNGRQGVFVGAPLIPEQLAEHEGQIEDIWFSNIQELPPETNLAELFRLIEEQLCRCESLSH
jgi:hypothetical protein